MTDDFTEIGGTVTVKDSTFKHPGFEFNYWTIEINGKPVKKGKKKIKVYADDEYSIPTDNKYVMSMFTAEDGVSKTEGLEVTFVANWKPKSYNIEYVSGTGDAIDSLEDVDYFTDALTKNDQYFGYTFKGWYQRKNGKGYKLDGDTRVADLDPEDKKSNIKVYAYWKPNTYDVLFHLEGGSSDDLFDTTASMYDDTLYPTATLVAPAGKKFAGWFTSPGGPDAGGIELKDQTQILKDFAFGKDTMSHIDFYAYWVDETPAKSGGSFSMWTESDSEAVVIDEASTATNATVATPVSAPAKRSVAYKAAAAPVQTTPAASAIDLTTVGAVASVNAIVASASAASVTSLMQPSVQVAATSVTVLDTASTTSSTQANVVLVSAPSQSAETPASAGSTTPAATDAVPATTTTTTTSGVPASNTSLPPVSTTSAVTPAAVTSGSDDDKRACA